MYIKSLIHYCLKSNPSCVYILLQYKVRIPMVWKQIVQTKANSYKQTWDIKGTIIVQTKSLFDFYFPFYLNFLCLTLCK